MNHLKCLGWAFRHQEQLLPKASLPGGLCISRRACRDGLSDSHLRAGSQVRQAVSVSPGKAGETSVHWAMDVARVAA